MQPNMYKGFDVCTKRLCLPKMHSTLALAYGAPFELCQVSGRLELEAISLSLNLDSFINSLLSDPIKREAPFLVLEGALIRNRIRLPVSPALYADPSRR